MAAASAARMPLMQNIQLEQERISALSREEANLSDPKLPESGSEAIKNLQSIELASETKKAFGEFIKYAAGPSGFLASEKMGTSEGVQTYRGNVKNLVKEYSPEKDPKILIEKLLKEKNTSGQYDKALSTNIDKAVEYMQKYYEFSKRQKENPQKKQEIKSKIKESESKIDALEKQLNGINAKGSEVSFNIPISVNIDGAFDTAGLSEQIKQTIKDFIKKQSAFPGLDGPKYNV